MLKQQLQEREDQRKKNQIETQAKINEVLTSRPLFKQLEEETNKV